MRAVREIDPLYRWSRDYAKLYREMQQSSKICMVDYQWSDGVIVRDIARTTKHGDNFEISCRGTGYIWAMDANEASFIMQCTKCNVEWMDASSDRSEVPADPDCPMACCYYCGASFSLEDAVQRVTDGKVFCPECVDGLHNCGEAAH